MPLKSAKSVQNFRNAFRNELLLQRLEGRLLFDGVAQAPIDVDQLAIAPAPQCAEVEWSEIGIASQEIPFSQVGRSIQGSSTASSIDSADSEVFQESHSILGEQTFRRELIVVDSSVADYRMLLSDMMQQATSNRSFEVAVITSIENGIAKLTDILSSRDDIDTIHILAPGNESGFRLGSQLVTAESLPNLADQVGQWKSSLSQEAEILLYGAEESASETGRSLIDLLAELTESEVSTVPQIHSATPSSNWAFECILKTAEIEDATATPVENLAPPALSTPDSTAINVRREIAFVDMSFEKARELLDKLDPSVEVIVLTSDRNGVEQIAEVLATRRGLDAIHILSHGSEGSLSLGTATLNGGTMRTQYTDELTVIGAALKQDGDLMIWGCDFGRGAIGAQTAQLLSEMTGADIAASVNLTGHAELNADWNLELKIGSIEASRIVTLDGQQQWRGVLSNVITPFSSRFTTNDYGDITMAANTLLWSGSVANNSGTGNNNSYSMVNYDVDGATNATTFNSSRANLVLPTGATVLFAGLYWGANSTNANRTQILFDTPSTANYTTINGTLLGTNGSDYAAFANVTSMVQTAGAGTYTAANVQANVGGGMYAGWSLVVVYRDPNATAKNLTVFDGFAQVNTTAPTTVNIPISGFIAPPTGAVNAKIGAVAFEGDRGTTGDFLQLNGLTVTDGVNPGNNFFNSSITNSGADVSTKDPNFINQTGFDADIVAAPTGAIANGATSATLTMGTGGDFYYPSTFTSAIEIYAPDIQAAKSGVDINGGDLMPGDIIEYTIVIDNQGGDGATNFILNDNIPNYTNYVAGSLQVLSGANAGVKTDALGDDQAEYIAGTDSIRFRLGTGADATNGGALGIGGSTTIRFRVQVEATTPGNTAITNQANLTFRTFSTNLNLAANTSASSITVPANDPPVNTVPSTQTMNEDATLVFSSGNSNLISVADPDAGTSPLRVTLTVTNGTLSLSGIAGLSFTTGDGTSDTTMTFTGTAAAINTALAGMGYAPNLNYNGPALLTITTNDLGNSGVGGPLSDTDTVNITVNPVNDPPVASNDSFTTNEDTAVGITVKSNDSDIEGNTLTITQVNGTAITAGGAAVAVTNGTVSLNAAGTILTFTPSLNYNGPASFTYTISDGAGGIATATVSGNVTAVNDPPVASNDSFGTINEESSASTTVKSNDSDADGNPITITQVNGTAISPGGAAVAVTNGSVTLSADGNTLTFTPNANYNGPASYTYTISDGQGGTATATVSGTVTAVNDAPVNTLPASFSTNEDTALTLSGLSIADVDAASGNMTITLSVTSGTIAATAGGGVAVGGSGTNSITLTGTLANLNTFLSGSTPVFTPASNFNGNVTLTMLTSDLGNTGTGGTLTDSDTRTITVNPVNDAPIAVNDSFGAINEDTSATTTVLTNDSDVDGNPLSVTQVNGTSIVAGGAAVAVLNGMVSLNAAGTQLTFTPTANYNGPASYTYTISDGAGGTATATVSGTISAVNDPPVAVNDSFTTNEDTAVGITVKSNDSDIEGNPLTITHVNGTAITAGGAAVSVTNGTVSLNAAGTILTFTPSSNYNGPASFTYTISDGAGGTATATVSGTVNAVNDPPVAGNDSFGTINEDTSATTSVLTNDSDVDGNPLAITQVNGTAIVAGGPAVTVTNGTVSLNAAGTQLTFTPTANYNGAASYTYTISDGQGGTATATVNGTISAVNDPPVAVNDSFTTNEDTSVGITVKSNDSDIEGNPLTITQVNGTNIVAGGASIAVTNGTVSLNAAGTILTFAPSSNYNGPASFTYTISDGAGGTATATVNGTVMAVNDPPVAGNDSFTTNEDTAVTVTALTNDTDVDGNPLSITHVNGSAIIAGGAALSVTNGTVSLNAAGTQLTFTPSANYNGPASFTYTISDGQGGTSTATISGTVNAVNDPPVAGNDSFTTTEDTPVGITVKSNDSDVDGNLLTITQVNGVAITAGGASVAVTNGTVSLNAAGTILAFNPATNYNGPASFTYTISDGAGGTATATVSGSVGGANDAPVAVVDTNTTFENNNATGNVLTNDADLDGDTLTVSAVNGAPGNVGAATTGTNGGSFTIQANGNYTFNPGAAFDDLAVGESRTTSVSYQVSDGNGGTATTTVTVTVTGTNDAPTSTAIATQNSTDSQAVILNVSGSFSDPDGSDALAFSASGLPAGLSINPTTGVITGTIAANSSLTGPYTVTVTAVDPHGATTSQTFTWNVANPAPNANGDSGSLTENATATGNVLTNDSDPDGDSLTVSAVNGVAGNVGASVTGSNGGSFTINSTGGYTFDPGTAFDDLANGETRTTTLSYTISDGQGGTDTAVVTMTITGTNDAPTSTPISVQNSTDSASVTLNVSGNFSDPDASTSLTFSSSTLPPGLTINPTTGVITGTIASNASVSGPYSVTITGTDPSGAATSQTFTWNVSNPAPTANNDSGAASENASTSGNVRTNDTDPDGDTLSVSSVNGATGSVGANVTGSNGGTFNVSSTGAYTFAPGAAFDDLALGETRTTTVSYTISDGQGGSSTATLSVTVTGTNDAPTSTPIAAQTNSDSSTVSMDISGNFADSDGSDTFTFSATNLPPGLSINPTTGVITGTINSNASVGGPYSVTIIGTDPHGAATSQTFTWTVTNPAPTATLDANTVNENGTAAGNVLSNDSDPDGDTLTVGAVNGSSANVGNPVAGSGGGTFSVNSNGSYSFSPGSDFEDLANGETRTTTVSYTATDSQGGTSITTLTITVTGTNDAPTSVPLGAQGSTDGQVVSLNVSGNFADPDSSNVLSFSASNLPPGLSINSASGLISGTIDHSASVGGPYSVTITATDALGAATSQTFTWNIANPAPSALSDSDSVSENGTTSGNVLTNDTDPDGDTLNVSAVNGASGNVGANVAGSNGGTFTIGSTGAYTFNPGTAFDDLALGETRTTTVSYTSTDNEGGTSTTTLTITVTGTNDGPVSTSITNQIHNDSDVVNVNLSSNFSDPDGSDVLTFSASNLPTGLSIDANTGVVTGTIDPGASAGGPYTVTVIATDSHGATTTQTFTWVVANVPPTAFDDFDGTTENSLVTGNVLANDVDPDGDQLVVAAVNGNFGSVGSSTAGSHGGYFTINANGSYTFIPGTDFDDLAVGETRSTTIQYTADDNNGGAVMASLTVMITGVNDSPVSTPVATQAHSDGDLVTVNVSGSFSDPDSSDTLTFSSGGTLPPGLSIDPNTGVITGTIASNASVNGPYAVTITATDLSGSTTSQTFTWNVTNRAPTAVADTNSTSENATASGNVIANDNDPDNDTLTVSAVNGLAGSVGSSVTGSSGGSFTIASTGAYTFNPGTDFDDLAVGETRTTSVSYTISDGQGGISSAVVTMTVTGTNDTPTSTAIATQNGVDNTPVTLDVSSNFSDPDSTDVLTFSAGTTLPPGLSINSATGVITGTIAANASVSGPYTVTITATDPQGATTSQTFTWNVTNPAPTANADTATVATGAIGSGNVLINDTDPDGDAKSVSAVNGLPGNVGTSITGYSGGTFTINSNGSYTFDPGTAFADLAEGETRTTTVNYTMTDSQGGFSTTTVTITVVGGNEAPTSTPIATQNGIDNTPVTLDVSGNFSDPDASDVLTFSAGGTLPPGLSIDPNTGVITGTISPSASTSGPYSVTITATDPYGATTSQSFTWNVTNPAPTAVNDSFTTTENSSASGNVLTAGTADSDPDGDVLLVSAVNGVAGNVGASVAGSNGGTFTIGTTGALTFNPGMDFNDLAVGETRTTTVNYTISDGQGGTSSATVTFTVVGTNDAPVSTAIATQNSNDNSVVNLNVSGNFSDPDGSNVLVFDDGGSLPPGLSIDPNTGLISGTIDSSASVNGPYSVTITATDPSGAQTSQTFIWNVSNPAPTAVNDTVSITENGNSSGNVLSNDNDPDNDPLTVTQVNGVSSGVNTNIAGSTGGTFFVASNGAWAFNPGTAFDDLALGETRTTTVSYTISDGEGGTDTATIIVTVTGTNDAPTSTPIATQNGIDNTPVTLNVSGNFADRDGSDVLTFSDGGSLPPGLSINPATGVISGTIDSSASVGGPYTVSITATDPHGVVSTQTFTWNIANPIPTAIGESLSTTESVSLNGNVLTNDVDPDGDTLTVSAVNGQPANLGTPTAGLNGGSFTINSNGSYVFNPGNDFSDLGPGQSRTTSVSYTISDGDGGFSTATISVTVSGNNDTPVLTAAIPTQENTGLDVISLNVSGNFSDPDAIDTLTFTATNLPPGLTINPITGVISGTITATAAAGGPYSVSVSATDPHGASISTTFTWNVVNPDLVVTVDDSGITAEPGDTVVFTINYANVNDRDATGVVLTQSLPTNTTFNASASSPGWIDNGNGTFSINLGIVEGLDSGSLLFAVTLDASVPAGVNGIVTQSVIADDGTNGNDLTLSNNSESESTPVEAAPNVGITVTPPATSPQPGGTANYVINYGNTGNQGATGVVITMTLPPNATFNPSTSSPGWVHQGNGVYTFNVASLPAGGNGSLNFAFDLPASMPSGVNDLTLVGGITDDGSNGTDLSPNDNMATNVTPVNAAPEYRISITDDRTRVIRGDTINYQIAVVNQGNQDGTGLTVTTSFPSEILQNLSPSHGGIVDLVANTITWQLADLAAGEQVILSVQAQVSMTVPESIVFFSLVASVEDDGANGGDPVPQNNISSDMNNLLNFNFDSLNNRAADRFGVFAPSVPPLTTRLSPLPVDPIFSGLTAPGSTLVGKIYDQHGSLIGERQVVADSSGNWMMTFPNSLVMENPHRMEIHQTSAIQSLCQDSGFNFRRYFHPTAHSSIFFTTELTINEVLRRSAYEMISAMHGSNLAPFGMSWNALAYELTTASSNAGQGA